jgi:transposase-like protein
MQTRKAWKQAIETGTPWSRTDGEAALEAQKKSGESVAAFARRHGIVVQRLYWWRHRLVADKKRMRRKKPGAPAIARLIPLSVIEAPAIGRPAGGRGVVVMDGGLRVEVEEPEAVSPTWVAALIRTVRGA